MGEPLQRRAVVGGEPEAPLVPLAGELREQRDHLLGLAAVACAEDGEVAEAAGVGLAGALREHAQGGAGFQALADQVFGGEDAAGAFAGEEELGAGLDRLGGLGALADVEAPDDAGRLHHLLDQGETLEFGVVQIHGGGAPREVHPTRKDRPRGRASRPGGRETPEYRTDSRRGQWAQAQSVPRQSVRYGGRPREKTAKLRLSESGLAGRMPHP